MSAGRTSSWRSSAAASTRPTAPSTSNNNKSATQPNLATTVPTTSKNSGAAPAKNARYVASKGRTRDIQCHQCTGLGHYRHECPSRRAMIIREDGGYESASDLDEATLALIAEQEQDHDDSVSNQEIEIMGAEAAYQPQV